MQKIKNYGISKWAQHGIGGGGLLTELLYEYDIEVNKSVNDFESFVDSILFWGLWVRASDLLQKVRGEYLPTLCNSSQKGKRNHEVISHREEWPGVALLRLALCYSVVLLLSSPRLVPNKDTKRMCQSINQSINQSAYIASWRLIIIWLCFSSVTAAAAVDDWQSRCTW